jgi:hypothetical protein
MKINAEANEKRNEFELGDALKYNQDSESDESSDWANFIGKRNRALNLWKSHMSSEPFVEKKPKSRFGFNKYKNRYSYSNKYKKSASGESDEYEEVKRNLARFNNLVDFNDDFKRSRAFSRFKPKGK